MQVDVGGRRNAARFAPRDDSHLRSTADEDTDEVHKPQAWNGMHCLDIGKAVAGFRV